MFACSKEISSELNSKQRVPPTKDPPPYINQPISLVGRANPLDGEKIVVGAAAKNNLFVRPDNVIDEVKRHIFCSC